MTGWRARLVLSVVVLALLAAGCSDDASGDGAGGSTATSEAVGEADARAGLAVLHESIPEADVHGDCHGHGLRVDDAREAAQGAARLCVQPPLPWGARDIWYNQTGLLLTVDEEVWADRLDRVCKTALGPDLDSPVWDRAAGLALAEEFADADGLRPDAPPDWREQFLRAAAGTLWMMIVQRTGLDGPNVCWDRVPMEFIEAGLPSTSGQSRPPGFDSHMTDEALAAVVARFDRMLWWVEPPLPPGTRDIWWVATGLRATIDEDVWADRLNRACNTPPEDPVWDRAAAAALAGEFIVEDGGEPSPELVKAGADALWPDDRRATVGGVPVALPAGHVRAGVLRADEGDPANSLGRGESVLT